MGIARVGFAAVAVVVVALVGFDLPRAPAAPAPSSQVLATPTPERIDSLDFVAQWPVVEAAPAVDQPGAVPQVDDQASAAQPIAQAAAPAPAPAPDAEDETTCAREPTGPLPRPGSPGSQGFWDLFRAPLPAAPLWNPPGARRVGLQAGHWLTEQVPPELRGLDQGSSGGGKAEWQVNLDLAQRTAARLEEAGVQADVLPATVPVSYRANAFLAIHADGDTSGSLHGFKVARPGFSSVPDYDDRFVDALNAAYAADTGMPRDDEHISRRMTYYYAFNSRRYCHAVAPGVPQAIIETGFLTSAVDRQLLLGDPDTAARGIADGVLAFLAGLG